MDVPELFEVLSTWTPYLAGGFLWNVVISAVSMVLGTVLGAGLALARLSRARGLSATARVLTEASRNVPTFICLFYLAFLLPSAVHLGGGLVVPLPAWLKASLAMSVAVTGYISDTLFHAVQDERRGHPEAKLLFVPNWMAYFLIVVMASSTASVIGVSEIVSRANTVIGATDRYDLMVWIYLYAMLWFILFCWPLMLLVRTTQRHMRERASRSVAAAETRAGRLHGEAQAPP